MMFGMDLVTNLDGSDSFLDLLMIYLALQEFGFISNVLYGVQSYKVVLSNCSIGESCVIHHGVCIGQDGFEFFIDEQGLMVKKPQGLKARIGNHVEIGANTCIDRGSWRDTIVGDRTKIDNLVQIGHNVEIGKSCTLFGKVGIAGSATIGDYVTLGGRVSIRDHVSIASKVRLAANSYVTKNICEAGDYGGFPAVYFAVFGCLKNVRDALYRGRMLKCSRCRRPGAATGCRVDRCPKTYHLPCARAKSCIFGHRKFLIACTDHRRLFQPHGIQNSLRLKKIKTRKLKLELWKVANESNRKDIEAIEKWLENCGEDDEFLKRESKRLQRDLCRIVPTFIGGENSEQEK